MGRPGSRPPDRSDRPVLNAPGRRLDGRQRFRRRLQFAWLRSWLAPAFETERNPVFVEPTLIPPGHFETQNHFYPRVLNAHIHPLIRNLMDMSNEQITSRYCHLHPEINQQAVRELLASVPRYFRWGGCDLFHVTSEAGLRQVVVIETNSCPSGQKSMPRVNESLEKAGYDRLLRDSFLEQLSRRKGGPGGALAVLYDKNHMENSGYAAAMADLTGEDVWLVPFCTGDVGRTAEFDDRGQLFVLAHGERIPVRAAFRYVTQRPWDRIPTQ